MDKVIIYTGDDCINCHKAMEFFKDNNIDFEEHNTSQDPTSRKFLFSQKVMSVPYIIIGDNRFIGFTQDTKTEIYKALYK